MNGFLIKAGYYVDLYASDGSVLYANCEIISTDLSNRKFVVKYSGVVATTPVSWKCQAPYFEHGHVLEVANTLSEKSKNQS